MNSTLPCYKLLVIGAGPAGSGLMYNAMKQGRLEEFLDAGVAFIEKTDVFGCGSIGNYIINSDTTGSVFLESLPVFNDEDLFSPQLQHYIQLISEKADEAVPLEWVGAYYTELGKILEQKLKRHPQSEFYPNKNVCSIQAMTDGKYLVQLCDGHYMHASQIVFAMGGYQDHEEHLVREIFEDINLSPYNDKVVSTSSFFTREVFEHCEKTLAKKSDPKVLIIGGSHSAFSSASLLLRKMKIDFSERAITIMHRSKTKLFYPDTSTAHAEGYFDFAEQDICPLTKKVYRLAGLRLDSRDLLRQILKLKGEERRIELLKINNLNRVQVKTRLEQADLIIPAFGYKARTVPLYDQQGREIELLAKHGKALVNKYCQVIDRHREVIPGLYGIGLASGFVPWGELGGEPGFSGQTNGLWLYQNGVGEMILKQVLGEFSDRVIENVS